MRPVASTLLAVAIVLVLAMGVRLLLPRHASSAGEEAKRADVAETSALPVLPTESASTDPKRQGAGRASSIGSVPQVGEPSPASNPQPQDADWGRFARTTSTLVQLLTEPALDAGRMFRNVHLNPRDVYIPPSSRSLLVESLRLAGAEKVGLARRRSDAANAEFAGLLADGGATIEGVDDFKARLSPLEVEQVERAEAQILARLAKATGKSVEELKADPTTHVLDPQAVFQGREAPEVWSARGDKLVSATLGQLPSASAVADAEVHALSELGAGVASYFADRGCLVPAEVGALIEPLIDRKARSGWEK